MAIENNQTVAITYEVKSEGSVIDSNVGQEPLEFAFGTGQIISGLESRIAHMNEGEQTEVVVPSAEAYGDYNPDALQSVPKSQLAGVDEIIPGMQLSGQQPDGTPVMAIVKEVNGDEVVIDLNHPLAGKDLTFAVTVVKIQ